MTKEVKLSGRVSQDRILVLKISRLPKEVVAGFAALADLTGTISDAMDKLGLTGAVPASELRPSLPGKRMVGQTLTVRNAERRESVHRAAADGANRMGETDAYVLAEPGDVVVIEAPAGMSSMGGQSATLAHRHGCAGAIIEGSYRDPDASRALGFPIWARSVTPVTGKWRLETVEINGRVRVAGISVDAGDLVAADEAGIAVVPREHAQAVLEEARRIDQGDARRKQDIAAGLDVAALNQRKYK